MKPILSAAKDLLASIAAAHCIASYVVMVAWVLLLRPREDWLVWTVFVLAAPATVLFSAVMVGIFGIARGDEMAFAGFAITYAVALIAATVVLYRRRRRSAQPANPECLAATAEPG
jgi:hypothetical protein